MASPTDGGGNAAAGHARPNAAPDPPSSRHNHARTSRLDRPPTPTQQGVSAKALHFISTASPGTLAGIAVAFSGVTYAILGRLGLLVIGAVGGVIAFASLEAKHPDVARAVRGEKGPDVLDRLWLDLQNTSSSSPAADDDDDLPLKTFDDFRPETREALGGFVDAIIRDYVKWWYSPLVPTDHSFPLACRKVLNSYLISISNRMSRKRPADAFLDLLTNCSSIIIVFMSELAAAYADLPPDTNMTAADAIYNYLASNPDSRLASLLNQRQQAAKFKMVAEDLLVFLERAPQSCDPARVFLREILANSVLETTLQTCSKAEWINGMIVHLLEAGEPDLNQAIDVGMQNGNDAGVPNVFADLDGNVGNIGIAKPGRSSPEAERSRRKDSSGQGNGKTPPRGDSLARGGSVSEIESTPSRWSMAGSSSRESPSPPNNRSSGQQFTSFDQIVSHGSVQALEHDAPKKEPLHLHNASFTLHDDTTGDGGKIRNKPNWDYLIQVEPSLAVYSGWMIVRRYSDFETLHEILRRIATVSGATAFTELHKELPGWKMHTRESLRGELERYLRDACWYASLAESEGMKRFLEKSQGHTHGSSKSFGWETVGKNMLDALTIGPKGAVEGGKNLVGVFGLGRKPTNPLSVVDAAAASTGRLSRSNHSPVAKSPARSERASTDSQRSSVISTQPGKVAPMDRRASHQFAGGEGDVDYTRLGRLDRTDSGSAGSNSAHPSREHSRASSLAPVQSPSMSSLDMMKLPPPPDEIDDDYMALTGTGGAGDGYGSPAAQRDRRRSSVNVAATASAKKTAAAGMPSSSSSSPPSAARPARQYSQLSEHETRVAVELLFAVINEMYTLSSAWNIRRTLLTAAKSFLLRPGNPSLLTVQSLIQTTVLDANTSDGGIAATIRKMRENSVPTEEEKAAWPADLSADEKEKLAVKARRMLVQRGVPAALMGVMGQAATGEALGRVFDCLQIEEVARGLIFGLMLQVVRIVTH
ncbi:hypothetical protein L249_5082 [Ophiocordyceps polyrhachis-furcata BCC 54312]|uniref:PXA domain-containing protein n=1 Tax=Ophiocordyceps polyrhachis-furcata BCC 54312 TaxID=1330021 RepID=A0A367L386_9HYPO|nr:hypothetical protein L249_5082 [Ophiocordyceps polyrhachis-furcata BCC 54312]